MTTYINGVKTERQKIRSEKINTWLNILTDVALGMVVVFLFRCAFHTPKAEAALIIEEIPTTTSTQVDCYEFKTVQDLDAIVDGYIDPQFTISTDDYLRVIYTSKTKNDEGKSTILNEKEFGTLKTNYKDKIMMNHCETKKLLK